MYVDDRGKRFIIPGLFQSSVEAARAYDEYIMASQPNTKMRTTLNFKYTSQQTPSKRFFCGDDRRFLTCLSRCLGIDKKSKLLSNTMLIDLIESNRNQGDVMEMKL